MRTNSKALSLVTSRTVLLATLLILVAACAPAPASVPPTAPPATSVPVPANTALPTTASPTAAPKPAQTKQIILAESAPIKTLDPYRSVTDPEANLLAVLFDGLVRFDYATGQVVGDLAESWKVADDKVTWTFQLKKGIKFSDGTDFNAQAAKWALDNMRKKDFQYTYYDQFSIIQDVQAVDSNTLVFKTDKPFSPLLQNLAAVTAAMVSPTAYGKYGKDFASHPIGTGPYRLKSWEGDTVVLERNPAYTGNLPWADEIKYLAVPEDGARTAMLANGEADIVVNIPSQDVDRLKTNPKIRIETFPGLNTISFEINTTKAPLSDRRVRQALMYAVDRAAIVKNVLRGLGNEATSPLSPVVSYRKEFGPWPYDPQKAKQLLSDAGVAKGFDLNLWTPHGRYPKDAEAAEAVQGYLKAVGINANLKVWEWSPYVDAVIPPAAPNNPKDLFVLGRGMVGADFMLYRLWHSNNPNNITGYANPQVDQLVETARATFDPAQLAKIYGDAQQLIWEDAPFLFLYTGSQIFGVQQNVSPLKEPVEFIQLDKVSKQQ